MNKFNKALIDAIKKDEKSHMAGDFNLREVYVIHQDGSEFMITHSKLEKLKIGKLNCIIVFAEHNTPNLFVESDLKSVMINPIKGKKYKLKLQK